MSDDRVGAIVDLVLRYLVSGAGLKAQRGFV